MYGISFHRFYRKSPKYLQGAVPSGFKHKLGIGCSYANGLCQGYYTTCWWRAVKTHPTSIKLFAPCDHARTHSNARCGHGSYYIKNRRARRRTPAISVYTGHLSEWVPQMSGTLPLPGLDIKVELCSANSLSVPPATDLRCSCVLRPFLLVLQALFQRSRTCLSTQGGLKIL